MGSVASAYLTLLIFLLSITTMCISRSTPQLDSDRWNEIDVQLNDLIGPLHYRISNEETPADEAADELAEIITFLLTNVPEFNDVEKDYFERKQSTSLEEARVLKRELRKKAKKRNASSEDKESWLQAVRLHAFLLRLKHRKEGANEIRAQEKEYRRNFFKFAKSACNGTVGEPKVEPGFPKEVADNFFPGKYSQKVSIDTNKLSWFVPVDPPSSPFNQDVIRPTDVMRILKSKSPNTSPGEDAILFGVLARLPSAHHILATLYNKLEKLNRAPASWASSVVILAHKGGETVDPASFRMIALTSTLGKPYHQIRAERLADFMVDNGYIDALTQKAFLKGVNGCSEHIQVMQEVLNDAKAKNKTVHITFFDLADAFGSIPHNLIEYCCRHYHIPQGVTDYIMDLYSKLVGSVKTKSWRSVIFKFGRGIFTGDNLSPIIFNIVFQPLIDSIKVRKDKLGFEMGEGETACRIISKPFADDFEIFTNNARSHRSLQDKVYANALTMGLTFKASKCRTLSIVRGKPTSIVFSLPDPSTGGRIDLSTLENDPYKFLGSTITFQNSPQDHLRVLKEKLTSKLENIDKTKIRSEYKLAIYVRYALPSLRFHLSVHSLNKTHLDQLDMVAQKFLKSWLNIPVRGATSEGVFSPLLLAVKPVSQVYLEAHVSTFLNSKLSADSDTKCALKNAETREETWKRKTSTVVQCKNILNEITNEGECVIPTAENCVNVAAAVRKAKPKIMKIAKQKVAKIFADKSAQKARSCLSQGQMLTFLESEGQDISWRATIFSVPRGVLSFAVRAGTDCLATPSNLAKWGRKVSPKCFMEQCPANGTLGHLLSGCKEQLDRYTFRHDSVLLHLTTVIKRKSKEGIEVFADLPGHQINGGTVSPSLALTEQRPDIVIVDKSNGQQKITIVELTVGWDSESSFRAANERKMERYSRLAEDLREAGFPTTVMPLELGCRGVLDRSNAANLEVLLNQLGIRSFKKVRSDLGKLALLGSYRIWLARQSEIWTPGPLLRVGGCISPASSSPPSPSASPPSSSTSPPRASPPPPSSSVSAPTPSPPSHRPSFCSPS